MALAKAAWRDFELNNAALSFSVILVGRNEQDGYLKDRASETPEDIRVRKHYEGVTLIEKLCKECGADMRLIAAGAKLVRYDRIRDWYLADVRSLQVHAPTLLMAVPGAEWALVDMEFDAALEAIQRADDETDGRWRKSIAGMSRDDRRYRTIARLIVQA